MFQVFIVRDGKEYHACSSEQIGPPQDLYLEDRCLILKSTDNGRLMEQVHSAAVCEAFALEVSHISIVDLTDVLPESC